MDTGGEAGVPLWRAWYWSRISDFLLRTRARKVANSRCEQTPTHHRDFKKTCKHSSLKAGPGSSASQESRGEFRLGTGDVRTVFPS